MRLHSLGGLVHERVSGRAGGNPAGEQGRLLRTGSPGEQTEPVMEPVGPWRSRTPVGGALEC